jgi:hypothetical protein
LSAFGNSKFLETKNEIEKITTHSLNVCARLPQARQSTQSWGHEMDDNVFVKIGCYVALIFFVGYIIQQNAGIIINFLFLAIFGIVATVAILFFLAHWRDSSVESRIWRGMPENGPMKVNLEIEQRILGKHRLHVDIKMTRKDWDALVKAGFHNTTLCEYKDKYTDDMLPFSLSASIRKKYIDFYNSSEARSAKETIIGRLHALRSQIELQHDFVARPQERKETLEI